MCNIIYCQELDLPHWRLFMSLMIRIFLITTTERKILNKYCSYLVLLLTVQAIYQIKYFNQSILRYFQCHFPINQQSDSNSKRKWIMPSFFFDILFKAEFIFPYFPSVKHITKTCHIGRLIYFFEKHPLILSNMA